MLMPKSDPNPQGKRLQTHNNHEIPVKVSTYTPYKLSRAIPPVPAPTPPLILHNLTLSILSPSHPKFSFPVGRRRSITLRPSHFFCQVALLFIGSPSRPNRTG